MSQNFISKCFYSPPLFPQLQGQLTKYDMFDISVHIRSGIFPRLSNRSHGKNFTKVVDSDTQAVLDVFSECLFSVAPGPATYEFILISW